MKTALDILFSRKQSIELSISNEKIELKQVTEHMNRLVYNLNQYNQAIEEIDQAIVLLQNGETDVKSKNSRKSKKTEPTSSDT